MTEQRQHCLPVVAADDPVAPGVSTRGATLYHDQPVALGERPDRLHRAATAGCPITRGDVDMPGPQAVRAVAGVPRARDLRAAVQAAEVLPAPGEAGRLHRTSSFQQDPACHVLRVALGE